MDRCLFLAMASIVSCGPEAIDPASIELAFIRSDETNASWRLIGAVPGEFTVELLGGGEPGVQVRSFDWSFDGEYLVASRSGDEDVELVVLSLATGETTSIPGLWGVACSPKALECLSRTAGDGDASHWLVDLETGSQRLVQLEGDVVDWSPDGARLAVFSSAGTDAPHELQIVDTSGETVTEIPLRLADGTGLEPLELSWSPAGDLIAFTALDPTGTAYSKVFTVDVVDHEVVMLSDGSFHGFGRPVWSPDGTQIAAPTWGFDAISPSDYAVIVFEASNGVGTEVLRAGREFAWAPDGRRAVTMLWEQGTLDQSQVRVDGGDELEWSSLHSGSTKSDAHPRWRTLRHPSREE